MNHSVLGPYRGVSLVFRERHVVAGVVSRLLPPARHSIDGLGTMLQYPGVAHVFRGRPSVRRTERSPTRCRSIDRLVVDKSHVPMEQSQNVPLPVTCHRGHADPLPGTRDSCGVLRTHASTRAPSPLPHPGGPFSPAWSSLAAAGGRVRASPGCTRSVDGCCARHMPTSDLGRGEGLRHWPPFLPSPGPAPGFVGSGRRQRRPQQRAPGPRGCLPGTGQGHAPASPLLGPLDRASWSKSLGRPPVHIYIRSLDPCLPVQGPEKQPACTSPDPARPGFRPATMGVRCQTTS